MRSPGVHEARGACERPVRRLSLIRALWRGESARSTLCRLRATAMASTCTPLRTTCLPPWGRRFLCPHGTPLSTTQTPHRVRSFSSITGGTCARTPPSGGERRVGDGQGRAGAQDDGRTATGRAKASSLIENMAILSIKCRFSTTAQFYRRIGFRLAGRACRRYSAPQRRRIARAQLAPSCGAGWT